MESTKPAPANSEEESFWLTPSGSYVACGLSLFGAPVVVLLVAIIVGSIGLHSLGNLLIGAAVLCPFGAYLSFLLWRDQEHRRRRKLWQDLDRRAAAQAGETQAVLRIELGEESAGEVQRDPVIEQQSMPDDFDSIVYFIRAGPRLKIGVTADLQRRMGEFERTENPYQPELLGFVPGDCDVERDWHNRFDHLRRRGEWFEADDELLTAINSDAIEVDENYFD